MNSQGKRGESNIEEIAASILRMIADSAPATPNKLSPASTPPPPTTEARSNRDDPFDLPELLRSLHSLAHQISPQKGASNLNGHHIIAQSAPTAPNQPSAAYPPPPQTEAQSNHQDAFHVPALSRSLHSLADQRPPQIGASNLNGHRIDWQQRPSRDSREMPFDRRRSSWEQAAYDRAPGAAGLSPPPLRTTETGLTEVSSRAGGGGLESSGTFPPPFPHSPPSADIARQAVARKDTLVMGPMGQSRADVQSDIPMNDVTPPRMPGDSLGRPIVPAQFRAPKAEQSAPQTGARKDLQGQAETASQRPIPEGLIDKALVELLRPLLKEWLDSSMRSALERALHVEVERAKNRQ